MVEVLQDQALHLLRELLHHALAAFQLLARCRLLLLSLQGIPLRVLQRLLRLQQLLLQPAAELRPLLTRLPGRRIDTRHRAPPPERAVLLREQQV